MKKTIRMTIGRDWDLDGGRAQRVQAVEEIFKCLEKIGIKIPKKIRKAAADEEAKSPKYYDVYAVFEHLKLPKPWTWQLGDGWISIHRIEKVVVEVPEDVKKAFGTEVHVVPEEYLQ